MNIMQISCFLTLLGQISSKSSRTFSLRGAQVLDHPGIWYNTSQIFSLFIFLVLKHSKIKTKTSPHKKFNAGLGSPVGRVCGQGNPFARHRWKFVWNLVIRVNPSCFREDMGVWHNYWRVLLPKSVAHELLVGLYIWFLS